MGTLTQGVIDMPGLLAQVGGAGIGGTAVFVGTVRRSSADGPVQAIDYSAYEAMAEAEWSRIVGEAVLKWPEGRFAVQHRLGRVAVGEASIVVVAGTPHRADAFAACRWVVDQAKGRLPIWKKELLEGGESVWRDNGAPGPGAAARDR